MESINDLSNALQQDQIERESQPLIRDLRLAMFGCVIFLGVSAYTLWFPLSTQIVGVIRTLEMLGCNLCMVFGAILAFRTFGAAVGSCASLILLVPFFVPGSGWAAAIVYLLVMNSATKMLRSRGFKVGLLGTSIRPSTPSVAA